MARQPDPKKLYPAHEAQPQGGTDSIGYSITPTEPTIWRQLLQAFAGQPCHDQYSPQLSHMGTGPTHMGKSRQHSKCQCMQELVMLVAPRWQALNRAEQPPQHYRDTQAQQAQGNIGEPNIHIPSNS